MGKIARGMRWMAISAAMLLVPAWLNAQVVFSRRAYAEQGRTYQELWAWSASDGRMQPLTTSPQDHSQPMCSPDGKQILFVSDPYDSGRPVRNTTIKSIWSFDRQTRQEPEIWSASS